MFPDGGANNHTDSNRGCGGVQQDGLYTQSGFNLTNSASNYNNTMQFIN